MSPPLLFLPCTLFYKSNHPEKILKDFIKKKWLDQIPKCKRTGEGILSVEFSIWKEVNVYVRAALKPIKEKTYFILVRGQPVQSLALVETWRFSEAGQYLAWMPLRTPGLPHAAEYTKEHLAL